MAAAPMPAVAPVVIEGGDWSPEELAALVAAARACFRSVRIEGERPAELRVTGDGRALWALGEALDGPASREARAAGPACRRPFP